MGTDAALRSNHDDALPPAVRWSKIAVSAEGGRDGRRLRRLWCAAVGHDVDNRLFERRGGARACVCCGEEILREDGSETRVAHTLSCFLSVHRYVRLTVRDGHTESLCERCGHPLVVEERSRYADRERFAKRVHYPCGLFGHRVHRVAARDGFVELACGCGHSFLKERAVARIRHPLVCVATGHRVRFVARREGVAEFRCRDCGHPFCHPAAPPA